jgi:hypothetical protein
MYLTLIDLGVQFLVPFLSGLKGSKVPTEVAAAVQSAIDALIAHKADIISKSNLDAMRG